MFNRLYKSPSAVNRHESGPYGEERRRYLIACEQRGDCRSTLLFKARDLLWVASRLSVYQDFQHITVQQVRAVADDWRDRERACHRKLNAPATRLRFVRTALAWLRYLGHLHQPVEQIPFRVQLEEYCRWTKEERGFTEQTVKQQYSIIKRFLCWWGSFDRDLSDIKIGDVDAYLTSGSEQGWCRITINNVAKGLRAFFRYSFLQRWTPLNLAGAIQGPRIYYLERLPSGPDWADVQRLFAGLDTERPKDIRDRAILMLMAIYGLRASEVANLRLEDLDWQRNELHVRRVKRRGIQVYPLLPSVSDAIIQYLRGVRRHPSVRCEVFLSLRSPYQPISAAGLYHVAAPRLKRLGVQTAHHGPHCLRHACAGHLITEGLSLKEIGDHLGHRSTSATRTYTKVDLPGLRQVAAFDLGDLL